MDPRREFVLPSAAVGQPWQIVFVGRCANLSALLPLANIPNPAKAESRPYGSL